MSDVRYTLQANSADEQLIEKPGLLADHIFAKAGDALVYRTAGLAAEVRSIKTELRAALQRLHAVHAKAEKLSLSRDGDLLQAVAFDVVLADESKRQQFECAIDLAAKIDALVAIPISTGADVGGRTGVDETPQKIVDGIAAYHAERKARYSPARLRSGGRPPNHVRKPAAACLTQAVLDALGYPVSDAALIGLMRRANKRSV